MRAGVMAGGVDHYGGGRVTVYLLAIYGGIYAIEWRGAFLWRVYMADFKG